MVAGGSIFNPLGAKSCQAQAERGGGEKCEKFERSVCGQQRGINSLVKLFGNDGGSQANRYPVLNSHALPPQEVSFEAFQSAVTDAPDNRPSIDRVVRLMPGFVYVFNHQTYSNDYTNRSVGEHLGYSSEEIRDFGAQMLMHVVHAEDQHLMGEHMARIAQLADDGSASLEYRVITKNGEERWLRSVDSVFDRLPDGRVLRHIGVATDVTAEKQAELALTRLNAELEQKVAERTEDLALLNADLEQRIVLRTRELQDAIEELEQLTYIATHDLKVPVNNLSRLGLMLKTASEEFSPEQLEQIEWINTCTDQLAAKLQGLVLVAQIRLGHGLPSRALNLAQCVNECIRSVSQGVVPIGLHVAMNIAPDLEVQFSRFELESIVVSLLDNALKYADPGRPLRIEIRAETSDSHTALIVADNGTGLDPDRDASKVFGLFQRAHKTPSGNGISLYCAQRMLQRRGGALSLKGARGQGAQFTVLIPIKETVA